MLCSVWNMYTFPKFLITEVWIKESRSKDITIILKKIQIYFYFFFKTQTLILNISFVCSPIHLIFSGMITFQALLSFYIFFYENLPPVLKYFPFSKIELLVLSDGLSFNDDWQSLQDWLVWKLIHWKGARYYPFVILNANKWSCVEILVWKNRENFKIFIFVVFHLTIICYKMYFKRCEAYLNLYSVWRNRGWSLSLGN